MSDGTKTPSPAERAAEIVAVLRENSDAYHVREIGYERFAAVADAAWQDAEAVGVVERVREAVRRG